MKQFILELGKDFLYIDDEYTVKVGGKRKRIDLVFYHRALQCLVAIELKAVLIAKTDFVAPILIPNI